MVGVRKSFLSLSPSHTHTLSLTLSFHRFTSFPSAAAMINTLPLLPLLLLLLLRRGWTLVIRGTHPTKSLQPRRDDSRSGQKGSSRPSCFFFFNNRTLPGKETLVATVAAQDVNYLDGGSVLMWVEGRRPGPSAIIIYFDLSGGEKGNSVSQSRFARGMGWMGRRGS